MNKNELIESLAEELELTKTYARELVDRVFEKITDAANGGEEVAIFGFGKFKVVERQARTGRNPQTGAAVKIAAKKVAERAGVAVTPWSGGAIEDEAKAVKLAKRIGYPLVVKAAAGGGGRGIRVVEETSALAAAIRAAASEARAAFGDERLFLESWVRHRTSRRPGSPRRAHSCGTAPVSHRTSLLDQYPKRIIRGRPSPCAGRPLTPQAN